MDYSVDCPVCNSQRDVRTEKKADQLYHEYRRKLLNGTFIDVIVSEILVSISLAPSKDDITGNVLRTAIKRAIEKYIHLGE